MTGKRAMKSRYNPKTKVGACAMLSRMTEEHLLDRLEERSHSKRHKDNARHKQQRIDGMPKIQPNKDKRSFKDALTGSESGHRSDPVHRYYVNGNPDPAVTPLRLPALDNYTLWNAHNEFEPFNNDNLLGGHCEGHVVLANRYFTMEHTSDTHGAFLAYKKIIEASKRDSDGKLEDVKHSRRIVFEDGNNKYVLLGQKVDQGHKGLLKRHIPKGCFGKKKENRQKYEHYIRQDLGRVKRIARHYLDTKSIVANEIVRDLMGVKELELSPTLVIKDPLQPSMALALNAYLSLHEDPDFDVCVASVLAPGPLMLDSEILVYFNLPAIGRSIGLRNGDVIIFNPHHMHGMSSRVNTNIDVISQAHYMKRKSVGLNDKDAAYEIIRTKDLACRSTV